MSVRAQDPLHPGELRFESGQLGDLTWIRPVGRLDASTYADLRDTLLKRIVEDPPALAVDLDDLAVASGANWSLFPLVWMRTREWPAVPLVLVASRRVRRQELDSNAVSRYLRIVPDLAGAKSAAESRDDVDRAVLDLTPATTGVEVRNFVRRTLYRWGRARSIDDALLVATELVQNARRHAGAATELRVELRGDLVIVAVRDCWFTPPRLLEPAAGDLGVSGLRLLIQLDAVWGWAPTFTGGKVVWAAIRTRARGWRRFTGESDSGSG